MTSAAFRPSSTACAIRPPARLRPQQGLDHGVWVPLLHLLPLAEVPVIPLSMPSSLQPDQAFALGRAVRG